MKQSFHHNFISFVRTYGLFTDMDRLLLAVSGGVDSMVLAHVLQRKESEQDGLLVSKLAEELNVPVYIKSFDTNIYSLENKVSIQMAARELRYEWFQELVSKQNYDYIVTAHHKNDFAETVLMNLSKGSVIKGLQGIRPKNNNIVRPLLWASKEEILEYAAKEKIVFREDSSNASDKYQRNLIRHNIIGEFEKINPSFIDTVFESSLLRGQISDWFENQCKEIKSRLFTNNENIIIINKKELYKYNAAILCELLKEYNFSTSHIIHIFSSLRESEGKEFISPTHRIVKDRDSLSILPLSNNDDLKEFAIPSEGTYKIAHQDFTFTVTNSLPDKMEFNNPDITFLNFDKMSFPLFARVWEEGDTFKPFGMKGKKKKISDFLTDIKLGKLEKEKQILLLNGNDICWVVGKRIDERYRIEPVTAQILKICKK